MGPTLITPSLHPPRPHPPTTRHTPPHEHTCTTEAHQPTPYEVHWIYHFSIDYYVPLISAIRYPLFLVLDKNIALLYFYWLQDILKITIFGIYTPFSS